ncbi:GNAT family N-acetyltransferase [Brevibacillus sp. SYP-B805]|uniref:GNAT family N-acetyltransferase n=1 Tax=Brevibacillus sp. SYP-B805 TaxID=1578199 RepID=UPI0013EB23BC|nr:GNAT family N-acetyltransferase [Brevibacillus sp. SYP-B805]NGQ96837.1 GNAT family N-acetyltransferase [Brevibacillus sp. SYP-B805]
MNPGYETYRVVDKAPSVDEYLRLRREAGLSEKRAEAAAVGLANSLFAVTIYHHDSAVGMGRIIGDGGCFYQIVDIAVMPAHQGKGLGKLIMERLMHYLDTHAHPTAYVSLIADVPANQLYEKFGFQPTAPRSVGMYKRY